MVRSSCVALAIALISAAAAVGQDGLQPSQPVEQHKWLQQLVGQWESHAKMNTGPDQPAFESHGTEKIRAIGELWIVSEGETHALGMTAHTMLTLGYDPEQEKFIGTWIDSVMNHMWKYEGTLDESGKKLTLMTEGPSCIVPGERARYKEVLELKNKNERLWTTYVKPEGGEWAEFMSATAKRVK